LNEDEISQMTLSITTTRRVEPEVRDDIIDEFYEMCLAQKFITEGGIDYAREILERAVGVEKANELIHKLSSSLQVRPFDFIRRADSSQILNVIHNEHPQTIALVLSYIDPKQSAEVLASLPPERQSDIVGRIAHMGSTSPEYVHEAERILERKITSMGYTDQVAVGGIDAIVSVINSLDRSTEKRILESLDLHDSELAEEIRKRLFVFEDIAKLTNQVVQRILKEVNNSDLAIALKMSTEEVKKVIFSNISKRLQDMLQDDMDVMGPVRVRDVEEAQQRIVSAIRRLEDAGEIMIARGEGDDLIV
jgi:flagellar motor switch protein FliG